MPPLPDISLLSSKITVADICLWCGVGFRVLELLFTAALGVIKVMLGLLGLELKVTVSIWGQCWIIQNTVGIRVRVSG